MRIPKSARSETEVHDHRSSTEYNECAYRNVNLEFPTKTELVQNTSVISSVESAGQ